MTDTLFALDPAADIEALINDLLLGKRGPWPISDDQRKILRNLKYYKGAERTLAISWIQEHLRLAPRAIKAAMKSLVEDFGVPIGASRQEPYGYFLIITPEDLEQALRPLQNEITSLARRVRTLAGAQRVAEIFGQVRAEMEQANANG